MDLYVLVVIANLATGEERPEEFRSYYSLERCEQHVRALRRQVSIESYKFKFECRSVKSYGLLMPNPKA